MGLLSFYLQRNFRTEEILVVRYYNEPRRCCECIANTPAFFVITSGVTDDVRLLNKMGILKLRC